MPGQPIVEPPADLADEVLEVVRNMLAEVIGHEYMVGVDIVGDTSFDHDLELESLEFVALNELLRERYGDRVDFGAWLAGMEVDEIVALTVGDLVRFIASSLASEPASRA